MTAIFLTLPSPPKSSPLCSEGVRGFSRPVPAAIVVVGYGISFCLLALVLKHFSRRHDLRHLVRRRHRRHRPDRHRALRRGRQRPQARLARPYRARRDRAQCRRRALKTACSTPPAPSSMRDGAQALTLDAVAAGGRGLQGRAALPLQVQARPRRGHGRALAGRVPARDGRGGRRVRPRLRQGQRAGGQRAGDARGARRRPLAAGRGAQAVRHLAGSGRARRRAIRSTRPSPGWPRTGSGSPSCWAWDPRPESCASGYSNGCWTWPNRWIDWSVNALGCRTFQIAWYEE